MNFAQFVTYPSERKVEEVVVFDIDGVLADATHRAPLITGENPDWASFFAACVDDEPIRENIEKLDELFLKHHIVLLTSRPVSVREETIQWTRKHGVKWDTLVMRSAREDISSVEYKKKVMEHFLNFRQKVVVAAFDDDPRNVDAFTALGVAAVYVHSGYYE